MPGDRGKALQSLIGFVQRDLHERTRVLVVDARHATGLSTALQAVASHVPDPRSVLVIDDAQRALAASQPWLSTPGHQRVLLGVDTDDARDLGVDVSGEVEKLVAQKVIDAQKTELPAVPDEVLCNQIAQLWPSTPGVVATALAHHLNGRIALLAQAVELDAIQQRVRNGRLCMVPDQISRLELEPATLLEERWRSLDGASRRIVLIVCALAPINVDELLKLLERGGIERSAWDHLATLPGWIDVRGDTALAAKDVTALATVLDVRSASVALEVGALLARIVPPKTSAADATPKQPRSGAPLVNRPPATPPAAPVSEAPKSAQRPDSSPTAGRSRPAPPKLVAPDPARPRASHTPPPSASQRPKPRGARRPKPPTAKSASRESDRTPGQPGRGSQLIRQELASLPGNAAQHSKRAIGLRQELYRAYRAEGVLDAYMRAQQALVDKRVALLGDKDLTVARARLVLAEMLAELGSRDAARHFRAAIAALQDASGPDSDETKDARLRRKCAPRSQ
jgi:hypothetical protein